MELVGTYLFIPFAVLLVIGVPVGISLGLACVVFIFFSGWGRPPMLLVTGDVRRRRAVRAPGPADVRPHGGASQPLRDHRQAGSVRAIAGRLDSRRAGARQHRDVHVLRRHLRVGAGGCRIAGPHPHPGHDSRAVPGRFLRRRDRIERRHRRHHSAEHGGDHYRKPAGDFHRRVVRRRDHSGDSGRCRADDHVVVHQLAQ